MRKVINLNDNWRFEKTSQVPAAMPDWEAVTLPHTWNAEDGQDGGNDYWRGTAMYCRQFDRPQSDGRAVLEFPGAAMTADVYVNGKHLAHHEGGYSTFRVDVTGELREENLLCVAVDNSVNDTVYPQKADFTFYGGLYRGVKLILVPEEHFELIKDGTPGIKITPKVEGSQAAVTLETWQTGGETVRFTVMGDGRVYTAETAVAGGYAKAQILIPQAHLWDGVKDPFLYWVKAELLCGGSVKDEIGSRMGCRTFGFDPERGFLLNGREYPLRGVSRHQDRKGAGNALTEEMHREDMDIIREIGANTVRLAHYQHAGEFYDLADENGMVVWAEIPYITAHMEGGRENTLTQMRELVTQCYNHPSIVCWGLSNEITAGGSVTEDMLENHRLLNDLCHKMDPVRPTTMAHAFMLETDSPMTEIADLNSYNLYFGWYLGELEQNGSFFDEYHTKFPERIIGFSEYGADANPRYQAECPEKGDYTEGYQCVYHEHVLQCIEQRPYLWATHVWNLFDFAADGRDEGGKHGENQKGLVTFDRKLKKDAFYLYKAAWSSEPFVHLCGKRYVNREQAETVVKVYSNQPQVTLSVDGRECGTQTGSRIFEFTVTISGEHEITAEAGGLKDTMVVRKAEKADPQYSMLEKEAVVNWFDADTFKPDCFSIRDTMGTLMQNPRSAAIVGRMMEAARASRGEVAQAAAGNANLEKMMAGMTLENLLKMAGPAIKPEQVTALNQALQEIKKR
ncbi:MAG: glycoside hydrolase family 2 protein [bacterium]|nr:glycoside hydrolase family 2 protein [bacterium]MCM1375795.1 beta-galactosidase [Muribaculum sp.]